MELGEIIRQARQARGLRVADLAVMLGVKQPTVSNWEAGRRKVPPEYLEKLQAILGISDEVIEQALGQPRAVLIPVVGEVKAGAAGYALDAWRWLWVDPRLYPGATFAVQVWGDSMWPTLRDGDIAVCREAGEVVSGGIYVVGVEDHATVKRLKRVGDELYMLADNPEADWVPEKVRRGVRITGRVIGIMRAGSF